uniref:Uncharacterized protein n=1 Tax=Coccidioides posadasii RMSCC 3488 TaxID=454284 RepID=A0A0J6IEM6_COCPO|nr:hypothetical protein CPAG_06519 [Coccidioides posadasii RMSCC 3488]
MAWTFTRRVPELNVRGISPPQEWLGLLFVSSLDFLSSEHRTDIKKIE